MAAEADVYVARLQERYRSEILPALIEEFGYRSPMQAPRLVKVVVNMGVGEGRDDSKTVHEAAGQLALITGQKPRINKATKSVSNFKLRAGMEIGCSVTLRRQRMYEFLDRLFTVALPRLRDFRGLNPKGFDGHGNYSLGLTEQTVFPEIDPDKTSRVQGMNVTIVTSAASDREALALLKRMGLPLRDN
ncbi:MAG: 50S ribosomal protein L5 [Armatimonadetes bacterium]|nr:50S ribosomal protein L5 [Armatimonadota bacterium]